MSKENRPKKIDPARVLVCGSRGWSDTETLYKWLSILPKGSTIIEGEATGADRLARIWGKQLGFKIEAYPAEWQRFGRRAGTIRNEKMLRLGKPQLVIAFHSDIQESRGTLHMISLARRRGLHVILVESSESVCHIKPQ